MDQLAEEAHALKIYQELTTRLYEILRQLQNEGKNMQDRIMTLENQLRGKDQLIKQLQEKLKVSNSNFKVKENLVQLSQDIQSEPLLRQKRQTSETTESSSPKVCKIDINSYFKGLISQKTKMSTQSYSRNSPNPHDNLKEFVKQCKSTQESSEFFNVNFLSCQKIAPKVSNLLTQAQTSQSNSKEIQQTQSNKENEQFMNPNVSSNFSIIFDLHLDLENIGKKEAKILNQKQKRQTKTNQSTLNVSNFISKNIKTRKPSFAVSRFGPSQY